MQQQSRERTKRSGLVTMCHTPSMGILGVQEQSQLHDVLHGGSLPLPAPLF